MSVCVVLTYYMFCGLMFWGYDLVYGVKLLVVIVLPAFGISFGLMVCVRIGFCIIVGVCYLIGFLSLIVFNCFVCLN